MIVICSFNSECRGGSVDMVLINLLIWLVCGVCCFSFWDKGFVRRRGEKGVSRNCGYKNRKNEDYFI